MHDARLAETAAFQVFNCDGTAPLLLICDHASNHVPPGLRGLGLPEGELARHIAWDIGAAELTLALAGRLGAAAILSSVSRLVIDCNRPPGHPTSICAESDGTAIPGNRGLGAAEAEARAAAYYRPYHAAIAGHLDRLEAGGQVAILVSIHSFTPRMGGCDRPWQAGVLWNRDPRLALPLIAGLRGRGGLTVGDNEPYSGRTANHTVDLHGAAHGRPQVSIEIRQDEIGGQAGVARWTDILAEELAPLLARPEMTRRQSF